MYPMPVLSYANMDGAVQVSSLMGFDYYKQHSKKSAESDLYPPCIRLKVKAKHVI